MAQLTTRNTSSSTRLKAGSREPARASKTRLLFVLVGIAAVGLGVFAFIVLRSGDDGGADATPELEHVHGLGVDSGDGVLYAGTHYGLFRIPASGPVTRVANRVQDFMGFTVAEPGRFLASGHPGEGQEGPGSVGLIESTDAGKTWKQMSLEGEADFHSLEFRHGRVYGMNAMTGEFMVSEDLKTWDTRTNLPMADFAVSPDDRDVILATTRDGLARSTDGGRSFRPVDGAPVVLLISWAEDGSVAAVTPDGSVYTAAGETAAWVRRGSLAGQPEAFTAETAGTMYAAAGGRILQSDDGGKSFTVRYGG
ncbi:MAG: F510_1955 family glycosylhydrolase [Aeromicrobium sp.]